jgi:hypothetical protein
VATIVFLNEQDQTVLLVDGNRCLVVPWTALSDIASVIRNKQVYYVTSAEFVPGQDVIDLLSEITGRSYEPSNEDMSRRFIRCVSPGKLVCRTTNGELVFEGPTDIKPLESLPDNALETSDNLRKCLEIGKVEIIDSLRRQQILAEAKSKKANKNARDKGIDNILIKTSVDDFLKKSSSPSADDIPEISISSEASFKKEDTEEVYSNLKKLGINPEA